MVVGGTVVGGTVVVVGGGVVVVGTVVVGAAVVVGAGGITRQPTKSARSITPARNRAVIRFIRSLPKSIVTIISYPWKKTKVFKSKRSFYLQFDEGVIQ